MFKSLNISSEWGNIKDCNKYLRSILNIWQWPVNDEPLNAFGTFELFSHFHKGIRCCYVLISKNELILNFLLCSRKHHSFFIPISKMYCSCYVKKIHHSCFLLISKMYCCFVPKWIVCSWHCRSHCGLFTYNILLSKLLCY